MSRYTLNRAELARLQRLIATNETGCWEWQGRLNSNGYGWAQRGPGHKPRVVHRIIWEHTHNEPVPSGMQLDHLCRNRRCCNPDHMEVVTASENTKRQDHHNRRKTHCIRGHEYTEENTRITNGKRACKECDRIRKAESKGRAAALQHGGEGGPPRVETPAQSGSEAGTPTQIGMGSSMPLPLFD